MKGSLQVRVDDLSTGFWTLATSSVGERLRVALVAYCAPHLLPYRGVRYADQLVLLEVFYDGDAPQYDMPIVERQTLLLDGK